MTIDPPSMTPKWKTPRLVTLSTKLGCIFSWALRLAIQGEIHAVATLDLGWCGQSCRAYSFDNRCNQGCRRHHQDNGHKGNCRKGSGRAQRIVGGTAA